MTTQELYIPTNTINLKNITFPSIRLGLQGAPGSGKTTAALTFPNPIVLALEPGLSTFLGKDIPVAPFYDSEWVCGLNDKKYKPKVGNSFPNIRDAVLWWLKTEALKLKIGQTLIFDSWSAFQFFESYETDSEPHITKSGKPNDFAPYRKKIEYAGEVLSLLCSMKCHVVVTFHEKQVRDKDTGRLLDKVAPLMEGSFVTELKRFFPDYFRSVCEVEKDDKGKEVIRGYKWQVKSDTKFDAKTTLDFPADVFYVEPNFNIFTQYAKKGKEV